MFQTIMRCAGLLKDKNLQQRCWEIVDLHANEVVKLESFLKVNQVLLLQFLTRDSLQLREIDLFKAFYEWIGFRNKRVQRKSSNEERNESYSHLVNQIRFPLMSQSEFAEYVPGSKLLSKDDIIDLFSYFCSKSFINVKFSSKPRAGTLMRCRLFPSSRKWFMYSGLCPEFITLTVSSSLRLCGVRMFGSENGKYSVDLQFYVDRNQSEMLTTKKEVYESESEMLNGYFGFDVLFDKALVLKASTPYTLKVLLKGPPSFYGYHGFSEVQFDGKTVILSRGYCPVFSRFRAGQFAEIIFM